MEKAVDLSVELGIGSGGLVEKVVRAGNTVAVELKCPISSTGITVEMAISLQSNRALPS